MLPFKRPFNEAGGPNYGFCADMCMSQLKGDKPWAELRKFEDYAEEAYGQFLYKCEQLKTADPLVQEREYLNLMYSILGEASEHGLDITQVDNEVLQYLNQAGYTPQGFESMSSMASAKLAEKSLSLDDLMEVDGFRLKNARTALVHDAMAREEGGALACPKTLYLARVIDYCCPMPSAITAINCPDRVYPGVGRNIMPPQFHDKESVPYKYDVLIVARKTGALDKVKEYATLGLIDATTLVYAYVDGYWERFDYLCNPIVLGEMLRKDNPTFPVIPDIGSLGARPRFEAPTEEPLPRPFFGPLAPEVNEVMLAVKEEAHASEKANEQNLTSLYISLGTSPSLHLRGWEELSVDEKICGLTPAEFFHSPSRKGIVDWFVTSNFLRETVMDMQSAQYVFNSQTIWAEIPIGRRALIKFVGGKGYAAVVESNMRFYKACCDMDIPDTVFRGVVSGDQRFIWVYDMVSHPDLTVDAWIANRVTLMDRLFETCHIGDILKRCYWYARPEMAITNSAMTALYGVHWYAPPYSNDPDRNWMVYVYQVSPGIVSMGERSLPVYERLEERQSRYWLRLRDRRVFATPFAVSKLELLCAIRLDWKAHYEGFWRDNVNHRRLMLLSYYLHVGYYVPQRSNAFRVAEAWGALVDSPKSFPTHFAYEMARRRRWCESIGISSPDRPLRIRSEQELSIARDVGDPGVRYSAGVSLELLKRPSKVGGVKPLSDLQVTEDGYYVV